jgi:hypothetical protein
MADNIISYIEMCRREALTLQAGMNFGVGGKHSVILMSVRRPTRHTVIVVQSICSLAQESVGGAQRR